MAIQHLETNGILPLEAYARHYDFTVVEHDKPKLDWAKEQLKAERFPQRRHILRRLVRSCEQITVMDASQISLDVRYGPFILEGEQSRFDWGISRIYPPLFVGGMERRVTSRIVGADIINRSIYIGPLPDWVADRYQVAKKLYGDGRLAVVSRERTFFDIKAFPALKLPPQGSPLLIMASPQNGDTLYLLAAWGLEYELPERLGGLLKEERPR